MAWGSITRGSHSQDQGRGDFRAGKSKRKNQETDLSQMALSRASATTLTADSNPFAELGINAIIAEFTARGNLPLSSDVLA
jgi:hypothetical protein